MTTNVEWQARLDKLFPDGATVALYYASDRDPTDPDDEWEPTLRYCPRPYCVAVDPNGDPHIGIWYPGGGTGGSGGPVQYTVSADFPLVVNAAGVTLLTLHSDPEGKVVMTSRIPTDLIPVMLKNKDALSLTDLQESLGMVW